MFHCFTVINKKVAESSRGQIAVAEYMKCLIMSFEISNTGNIFFDPLLTHFTAIII